MFRLLVRSLPVLFLIASPLVLSAQTWIPVAAHKAGLEGSVWRTDLTILNACPVDAVVELVLHTPDGAASAAYEIEAGRQQLFEDVVAYLADGEQVGSIEIRSDFGVSVTSRTYNRAADGTFGQGLGGVTADDAMFAGDSVSLQQLREDEHFRTNIGVLNMGEDPAEVRFSLFDRLGVE